MPVPGAWTDRSTTHGADKSGHLRTTVNTCGQRWTPGRDDAPACAVGGPKGSRSGPDHSHE
ncbi:hypothetical protein KPATCC21470_1942 [Kitasatospora purpeofusca]